MRLIWSKEFICSFDPLDKAWREDQRKETESYGGRRPEQTEAIGEAGAEKGRETKAAEDEAVQDQMTEGDPRCPDTPITNNVLFTIWS